MFFFIYCTLTSYSIANTVLSISLVNQAVHPKP